MSLSIAIALAAAVSALVGLVLSAVFKRLDPTKIEGYRACKGGWHEAFLNDCETGLLKIPQQPVNTYTNVAYLAGALLLALMINTPPAYVLALTSLYLCVGSALYHATSTRWAGSLDISAMYAVFSALAVFAVCALLDVEVWLVALAMLVIAGLAAYFLRYRYRGNMELKIGLFLGSSYALGLWHMAVSKWQAWPYLAVSFALFATAFLFWYLDKKKTFPLERWGHGLWHVLTAGAIPLLFYAIWLTP